MLSTKKDRLIVKFGKSRFSLSTLPVSDFPNIEEIHKKLSFSIPQNKLKQLLENTHFSMAQQDVRYYLNGMLIDINQGALHDYRPSVRIFIKVHLCLRWRSKALKSQGRYFNDKKTKGRIL